MDLNAEFPLDPRLCYLNHAAVAPWPKRTQEAVTQFARENSHWGARHYPDWLIREKQLREQCCRLLNANNSDDIALVKNTSEGLSMVAYGLPWQAGDNLIISDEEFPSNRIVWESLRSKGVSVKEVSLKGSNPEADILATVDQNTRLISLSSVQYASGFRLHLEIIGQFCQRNNILFCVDAIQSLGALPFDVQAVQADYVIADGHKWLLGPEGLALFYSSPQGRAQLSLNEFGWHMVEKAGDYTSRSWTVAHSARRFECGSPNMLSIHALSASLSVLLEVGMSQVQAQLADNMVYLIEKLLAHGQLELLSITQPSRLAGILTFKHRKIDSAALYRHLMDEQVICAHRGAGIRFSPHFYTSKAVLDRAVATIPKQTIPKKVKN